jgi:PAS domain S-box-containing protein
LLDGKILTGVTQIAVPSASRKDIRPLRDALIAGLVVFGCFASSASWIYHKARHNEIAHHREIIEAAAWRAAGSVEPSLLLAGTDQPPSAQQCAATLRRLHALEEKESPLARVTLLRPQGNEHLILYDTKNTKGASPGAPLMDPSLAGKLAGEEVALVGEVLRSGEGRTVTRPDGTVKSYAPVMTSPDMVIGVATAESAPHTLAAGREMIRWAVFSALVAGAVVAVGACLGVYSFRMKSQRAFERLDRAERVDRLIVETMGEVFYEQELTSGAMKWRGDVERLIGVPTAVLPCGPDWEERIHPADREAFQAARRRAVSDQDHFSVEYRVRREDGHFIWLLDRGGLLPGDEETGSSVIGVILDVTASREAQQRLRDVVDAAGEYIWEVNTAGRYTFISDRVSEVLGRTSQEMLGHEPFEYVPAADVDEVRGKSAVLVEKRAAFRDFEHRILRADGRVIWLSVNGVPSFDADGAWSGYRGAGLDISSRKEAEQALIQEKEAANAAVRTKSQFLAMMSHEIRTPLNSVLGFADLLSATRLDREQKEQVDLIRRSGDALLVLLNDILDLSRVESGSLALDFQDVNVRACLQDVMDLYRPPAAARNLNLVLDVDPDVPVAVHTDKARLRQIMLNLVGNAVKFTDSGSVKVRVVRKFPVTDGRVSLDIEVRDSGIGIPAEKVVLLFHPFSQVDSSATRRFGGTGLGLAICRRLAELLGCEVGLRASGPEGSVFYLLLNAAASNQVPATIASSAVSEPEVSVRMGDAGPSRVLVAEDNRVNRLLIRKMLQAFNVPSEEAENGRECVHMHNLSPYDVILMDVQMPYLDGLEATRLIRQNEALEPGGHRVTIIAVTADAMTGDRERCLEAGMDDYLSKPIRTEALSELLARYNLLARGDSTG